MCKFSEIIRTFTSFELYFTDTDKKDLERKIENVDKKNT